MCSFSITFLEPPTELIADLKKEIQKDHGDFAGNTSSENFDGLIPFNHFSGTYAMSDNSLDVTITHRTPFVNYAAIEDRVRHQLNSQLRY